MSHSKALGNNLDLSGIIDKAHSSSSYQSDVLELSIPGAEEGKWNWYLIAVLPFPTSTILLLLDIGDVSRGDLPEPNNVGNKKSNKKVVQTSPSAVISAAIQPAVVKEKKPNEKKTNQ